MVLQDLAGGKVSTVTYASMDPITKTLKTFAIDLTTIPRWPTCWTRCAARRSDRIANRVTGTIWAWRREQQVGDKDQAS